MIKEIKNVQVSELNVDIFQLWCSIYLPGAVHANE